jgi:hypothetical protein
MFNQNEWVANVDKFLATAGIETRTENPPKETNELVEFIAANLLGSKLEPKANVADLTPLDETADFGGAVVAMVTKWGSSELVKDVTVENIISKYDSLSYKDKNGNLTKVIDTKACRLFPDILEFVKYGGQISAGHGSYQLDPSDKLLAGGDTSKKVTVYTSKGEVVEICEAAFIELKVANDVVRGIQYCNATNVPKVMSVTEAGFKDVGLNK